MEFPDILGPIGFKPQHLRRLVAAAAITSLALIAGTRIHLWPAIEPWYTWSWVSVGACSVCWLIGVPPPLRGRD